MLKEVLQTEEKKNDNRGNRGHQEGGATEMVNIDCSPLKFFNMSITVESKNYETMMGFSASVDVIHRTAAT